MTEHNARNRPEPDFGCEYSRNLPMILKQLNISLAFTSYQAARLMLVRSDGDQLDINFKTFPRPMGLSTANGDLTLGVFTQVIRFRREDGLLAKIKQPLVRIEDDVTAPRVSQQNQETDAEEQEWDSGRHQPLDARADACFITRSSHHTGMINVHDIAWGNDGLWVVNSAFSCLATLQPDYSFVPRWQPHFITDLVSEDRCHLNGMCLKDGKPAFVTTFSTANEKGHWRTRNKSAGTLMDVARNEILLGNLTMPHSPRWYRGKVYYCNSGLGQLCCYDPATGIDQVLAEVPGFTRGMDFYGPILVLGLSRVRQSEVSGPLPLAQKYSQTESGLWFFNLDDQSEIGHIRFTGNVEQIYDVAVITGCSFPELIEPDHPRMRNHFCHPSLQPLNSERLP
jgi:uncharacterized protein (TIGR03032 family)